MFHGLVELLPSINASLNGLAAILLICGLLAIRAKKRVVHARCMIGAFSASSLFLVGYLIHIFAAGTTHFPGAGAWRAIYLAILFSHMLLAMAVVPLVLRTLFLALNSRFPLHRRIAKLTFPIWMYVSVTGVIVYLM